MDKKINFKAGAYIYIEGDENVESIFILESGRVTFRISNESFQQAKTRITAGDIFGFISSLCGRPRLESAIAETDSVVIELSRESFISMMQKNSTIAFKIINLFANELRSYDDLMFSVDGAVSLFDSETGLYMLACHHYKTGSFQKAAYVVWRYQTLYPSGGRSGDINAMKTAIDKKELKIPLEPVKQGIYYHYTENQIIFSEYEPGDRLFIIKEGRVTISKYSEGSEIILSVLKEGDIFGELAIVSEKTRNASASSYGRSMILPIDKKFLTTVISKSPEILKKIFVSISRRIWFTYIRLESKMYEKPVTRIYSFLENKLLEENISLKSREPVIFNFGIDELLKMTGVTHDMLGESLTDIMSDKNLNFNFGQIEIDKPVIVSTMSHYYKSRDKIKQKDSDSSGVNEDEKTPAEEYQLSVEVDEKEQPDYTHEDSSKDELKVSTELFDELTQAIE